MSGSHVSHKTKLACDKTSKRLVLGSSWTPKPRFFVDKNRCLYSRKFSSTI